MEYSVAVRAQSSQVKVLHSAGLAAIGRDSFAHGLETTRGAAGKLGAAS